MTIASWSEAGDQIDRTARQVRLRQAVHLLAGEPLSAPDGRRYRTRCGPTLTAAQGAVLTTVHANCWACVPGGVR